MPLASFALVILAAICHATWNLLAKRAADAGAAFIFAYNLVACIAYAPWALWLIARGAVHPGWPVIACIATSGLIHLAYSLACSADINWPTCRSSIRSRAAPGRCCRPSALS